MQGTLKSLRLAVAMLPFDTLVKVFLGVHTDARVHTASPRSSKPPLPPLHPHPHPPSRLPRHEHT